MAARRPPSLKLIAGTSRPDRAAPVGPALPALVRVPPAPGWLPNAHATQEWRRLAPALVANKLLHAGNIGAFGQACALCGKLVALWAAGETPTAALVNAYRSLCNDLGLSGWALPAHVNKSNRFSNNANPRKDA